MGRQIADLPAPPARSDKRSEEPPRAKAFEKFIHPPLERDFN
jgi:hypothetical protein